MTLKKTSNTVMLVCGMITTICGTVGVVMQTIEKIITKTFVKSAPDLFVLGNKETQFMMVLPQPNVILYVMVGFVILGLGIVIWSIVRIRKERNAA